MTFDSTDPSCLFRSFAKAERGGNCAMSSEEWLARLYCEPKAFWHCTKELEGSRYYTFEEINYPSNWLNVVEKYTGEKPSAAVRQLHRRVEAARSEFREKQVKAWGTRQVGSGTPERYETIESAAWARFNKQKQDYLADYLKAIANGSKTRRRLTHKCEQCGEPGVRNGFRFCVPWPKRVSGSLIGAQNCEAQEEMAPREIWHEKAPFRYHHTKTTFRPS